MDALVSVSRHGTGSTLGGTLFSKTFPCHNCARHIVASGIARVVFVEPYPKSLALKLHSDSISMQKDTPRTVHFVQYEGVSPKVASRFFAKEQARKAHGKLELASPDEARPIGVPEQPTYRAVVGIYGAENPHPALPLTNDNAA
jgi:deoxycytidylate deaminase